MCLRGVTVLDHLIATTNQLPSMVSHAQSNVTINKSATNVDNTKSNLTESIPDGIYTTFFKNTVQEPALGIVVADCEQNVNYISKFIFTSLVYKC